MAFPYSTMTGFESGTLGHFDTESDSASRLDFPHYKTLARTPGLSMPYRGAYCMRVNLATSTTDAYVQETGSWDMTAGTDQINVRFKLWISKDIVMATTNEFAILQFWSATNTVEAGVYLNYTTANHYRIGIGDTSATSFATVELGKWIDIEVEYDPAAAAGGTIDAWVDNRALTQVTGLTDADITSGVLGVIGQDAGTTAGVLLFDEVIGHNSTTSQRIGMRPERFPEQLLLESSGHAFVGHGIVDNVSLLAGNGTDCVLSLYDTDTADTNSGNLKLELKNLTANETPVDPAGVPIVVNKGCYVSLTGTNPRAMVQIRRAVGYGSDGAIRSHAHA